MNTIQLHTNMPRNITMIPNEFLDHYMSGANGEFLKIYLYLLRWAGFPEANITTASIADFFNMTENDIKRALRFWEHEGLLQIGWDPDGNISAICLRPVNAPYDQAIPPEAEPKEIAPDTHKQMPPTPAFAANPSSENSSRQIPSYSMENIQDFMNNDHGDELFIVIQEYTGKPLNQSDMNTILFFYQELGMSVDLIEHLFEYCISNGHRRINYIQAVAIGWAEAGIRTVEDAKTYCASFNQLNTAVMNAFGIKNRYLSEDELLFIRRWNKEFHFSQEIITEACRRTIITAGSASFKYANSILERWKDQQVKTLEDVRRLDEAFEKNKAQRAAKQQENKAAKAPAGKKPASRFHNFNQRSYDYGEMEMEFVKKLHSRSQK